MTRDLEGRAPVEPSGQPFAGAGQDPRPFGGIGHPGSDDLLDDPEPRGGPSITDDRPVLGAGGGAPLAGLPAPFKVLQVPLGEEGALRFLPDDG
jgi:hypothetical protein